MIWMKIMKKIMIGFIFVCGCYFFINFSFFAQNRGMAFAEEEYVTDSEMFESRPIIKAADDHNWKKVINIAKKEPASIYETDYEQLSVLHLAANSANDAVIVELLKLGADKNAKDISMRRPYDYAVENKKISPKVLKMLK